jgi:hypothetical protein
MHSIFSEEYVKIFHTSLLDYRDHGLVVEHVLAKDEMGVRFSLVAPAPVA